MNTGIETGSVHLVSGTSEQPEIFDVDWIENGDNTVNLRQSKAVGEPPLMLATSIWAAVKHALTFVSGEEIPVRHAPATNEEILMRIAHCTEGTPEPGGNGEAGGRMPEVRPAMEKGRGIR